MLKLTQQSYDLCMGYVGLNMRAASLFGPTAYTGLVRWHERNHEVYDDLNRDITKYVGNVFKDIPKYYSPDTYAYELPKTMVSHIDAWSNYLVGMKKSSYEMYCEAKDEVYDLVLADKFICMNKIICNEILYLSRFKRRIEDMPESELLHVNKKLHDYFAEHSCVKEIDFSI